MLFKYQVPGNGLGGGAAMDGDAAKVIKYLDRESEVKLLGRIRSALIFSVLSTTMQTINRMFKAVDILSVSIGLYFICTLLSTGTVVTTRAQRTFHLSYILHCISRQSVLVAADAVANNVHMTDIGTHYDNTLILVISTTAFIALLTFVPAWFIHDSEQGSIKDILMFSFTNRYGQLHITGLYSRTGIGAVLYGLFFTVSNLLDTSPSANKEKKSEFLQTLHQAAAMIFSRQFISQIVPASNTQVFPIAILLAMYIVSDRVPMSGSVAAFVLWRTAADISGWVTRVMPASIIDQIIFFCIVLIVLPVVNRKVAAVFAVAALQAVVAGIMTVFTYLNGTSAVVATVCLLLVMDIVLDTSV
jgi:hypothetical protein